jgi:hypothetical protein
LLYIDAASVISVVIAALCIVSIYLAYSITRITGGAPSAWYVIIAAFVVLSVTRAIQAYLDVLSPTNDIDIGEAITTLVVIILFVMGLFMLNRTFRKRLKVPLESSNQSS